MFFKKDSEGSSEYQTVHPEDTETLMSDSDNGTTYKTPSRRSLRSYSSISLSILSTVLALVAGLWVGSHHPLPSTHSPILEVSNYSPLLEDVDITFKPVLYNGSFLHANIYRQDASPEVDAAWEALGPDYRPLAVPEHLAEKAGISKDQVKIREKYGGGYPANVEGLHHLHCLNFLRKSLYYNYDYYHDMGEGPFSNSDHIVRYHVTHCLDILRQQLMCTVDIGVLGQVWWKPDSPVAFTDFNTVHQCRNFDAIRQWAEVRQLPEVTPEDFLEPPKPGLEILEEIP